VGVKGAGQKLKGLMWRQRASRSGDDGDDSTNSGVPGGGLRWWSRQMAPTRGRGGSGGVLREEMVM
jgi:hypothetical protein